METLPQRTLVREFSNDPSKSPLCLTGVKFHVSSYTYYHVPCVPTTVAQLMQIRVEFDAIFFPKSHAYAVSGARYVDADANFPKTMHEIKSFSSYVGRYCSKRQSVLASSSSTPSSSRCAIRRRMNPVLLASVSNHRAITMKVSGTMRVARIHHQYVMANKRPSGLKNTALKKDCNKSQNGQYRGTSNALELESYLPVQVWTRSPCCAETARQPQQ